MLINLYEMWCKSQFRLRNGRSAATTEQKSSEFHWAVSSFALLSNTTASSCHAACQPCHSSAMCSCFPLPLFPRWHMHELLLRDDKQNALPVYTLRTLCCNGCVDIRCYATLSPLVNVHASRQWCVCAMFRTQEFLKIACHHQQAIIDQFFKRQSWWGWLLHAST